MELSNKEAANMERSGVWGEGRDLGRSGGEGRDLGRSGGRAGT